MVSRMQMRERAGFLRAIASNVRRRRADAVAVTCGLVVLAISVGLLGRLDRVPEFERDVFRAINGLPSSWNVAIAPPMFLGTLASVPFFMAVCGLFRKYRMGFVLGVAGLGAYVLARLGKHLIGRGRPGEVFDDLHLRDVNATGLGFPSGHAAVSAAIVVAALPYLPRRWRWPALLFPVFMAFARVYTGAHLPLDVVSGAAIGVVVASSLHLLLGVPLTPEADPPVVAPSADGGAPPDVPRDAGPPSPLHAIDSAQHGEEGRDDRWTRSPTGRSAPTRRRPRPLTTPTDGARSPGSFSPSPASAS
jgi:membrane-associated phospholipid phosphatase